ncbi:HEAT repeat domain-containing protein [Ulvibacterium marinum]|uniref:HEAT repeat domain-containing protein n=1 Tax=Ulvibacterium marinum TaxID=2419782 RepID=UPI002494D113|nr:HEAT repeat domain-containing protein [Ulvibacterium marinum]
MEQERFDIWMMEYLSNTLDVKGEREFERFLQDHPEYQNQFKEMQRTWNQVDITSVPEPSEAMDKRFFDMLHSEIEKTKASENSLPSWFSRIAMVLWRPQMAYGILLLVLGLNLGYFLNSDSPSEVVKTTVADNSEAEGVRQQLVLTLLKQPSANERLQGINEATKIKEVDETVIKALLQTLNSDSNVNVRLAAIESLTNYLDHPTVREGLVQSIVKQDSPIVQVTLASLMVALQEKKSIESFKTLMRTQELDQSVKQKLETSINSII